MLIHDPHDQMVQVQNNTGFLLSRMAATTGYIDTKTTQKLLDITRQGATKYLNRATSWGFLKKHRVQMMNLRKRSIYGITTAGVDFIKERDHEISEEYQSVNHDDIKPWSIHKFRGSTHKHEMMLILMADYFSKNGVKDILNDFREYTLTPSYLVHNKRRADFGLISEDNKHIAVEVELTIKSRKRYELILWAYRKYFNYCDVKCIWIVNDYLEKKRLSRIFDELEEYHREKHIIKIYSEADNSIIMDEETGQTYKDYHKQMDELKDTCL